MLRCSKRDLQFIRFNGALIGGLAGLLLYLRKPWSASANRSFASCKSGTQWALLTGLSENQSVRRALRRNSPGVLPVQRRKAWRKFAGSLNPMAVAMSSLVKIVSRRYFTATSLGPAVAGAGSGWWCPTAWRSQQTSAVPRCLAGDSRGSCPQPQCATKDRPKARRTA